MIANAVTAFLDDRVGTGDGGSPAVVTADTTTTYAEVLALANRAARGLRALGVEPEQRVAVLLPDGLAWVATFFAPLRIGAIAVPFNTRPSAAEWPDMPRDSRARLFFAYALGNALLIPFSVGAQTYLSSAWAEPNAVAEIAASFRPTLLFSVPTFYGRLLRAGLPSDAFASVRCAVSAGERLPVEIG